MLDTHVTIGGNDSVKLHHHKYLTDFDENAATILILVNTTEDITDIDGILQNKKGPTRHAYAWQIGPFWQDTLDIWYWLNKRWRESYFIVHLLRN